jgi:hypothetical protein
MTAGRFCVLVNSSDRARDIFEIVFQNSDRMWARCDWPRFAGFTTAHPDLYGFRSVAAKGSSDWRGELADQLDELPPEIEYVLRLEEDALCLSPVDGQKLNRIAELMLRGNLAYVSLDPVSRSPVGRVVEYCRRRISKLPLRPISFKEPYYSAVVPAIWKRSYLRELLQNPGSIWVFEHIVTGERHYAVWETVLDQDFLVTKGRWNWRAKRQLARQGLSLKNSKRQFQTPRSWLRGVRSKISFMLFGYLSFRVRRHLNLLPGVPRDVIDNRNDSPRKKAGLDDKSKRI